MAWAKGRYYRRQHWRSGTCFTEYIGAGPLADLAAALDERDRALRAPSKQALLKELDRTADDLIAFTEAVNVLTAGALLLNGYHQHKRQWRKRRGE